MTNSKKMWLPAALLIALVASPAAADDKHKTRYLPKKVEGAKKKEEGWKKKLDLGASASLSQNTNVIGSTNGTTFALGAQIKSAFDYIRGNHEWLTSVDLGETFTYTSSLEEFIKTTDEFKLKTAYLYHIGSLPWLGPFAELKMKTALFRGRDIRNKTVTYSIDRVDGTTENISANALRMSDPFSPLTLEESIGAFAKPYVHERFNLEIRLGFSARQTFADDQLALKDDSDTDEIEIKELQSIYQGGPALGVFVNGALMTKRLLYHAQAEAMLPAINSKDDDDDRGVGELTNLAFEAGLSVKLVTWASLTYAFKAILEPQLVDAWQIQNNILLTFTYSMFEG